MAIDINISSQVSQTITNGVTTTAPSEDAVFDALETRSTFDEFISGQWNMPMVSVTATSVGFQGGVWLTPFLIRRKTTLTEIAVSLSAGTAGGTVRLAIYNSFNNAPNALLYETGLLDGTSGGLKSEVITPNLVLQPGLYFRAAQASASGVSFRYGTMVGVLPNVANNNNHTVFYQAFTYGAFPATLSAALTGSGNGIFIFLKPL
jgi:hypothetical protein